MKGIPQGVKGVAWLALEFDGLDSWK